ncbi:MAG: hypothetical protein JNN27_18115 [Planctomycetes bacterium]|nr:hypothetical protein [Planctomycetota bacterium]
MKPAHGLLLISAVSTAYNLWGLFGGGIATERLDAPVPNLLAPHSPLESLRPWVVALSTAGLCASVFSFWAGLRMRALRSWRAAVCANVLMMLPLFSGCLCLWGLPFGVVGLVVLLRSDVKRAFEANARA